MNARWGPAGATSPLQKWRTSAACDARGVTRDSGPAKNLRARQSVGVARGTGTNTPTDGFAFGTGPTAPRQPREAWHPLLAEAGFASCSTIVTNCEKPTGTLSRAESVWKRTKPVQPN